MDISMDIHEKSVDMDMDMDVIFHIHGNPALEGWGGRHPSPFLSLSTPWASRSRRLQCLASLRLQPLGLCAYGTSLQT